MYQPWFLNIHCQQQSNLADGSQTAILTILLSVTQRQCVEIITSVAENEKKRERERERDRVRERQREREEGGEREKEIERG